MRTGATSGVATKYLAKDGVQCAGIFGAGKQARSQLMAVATVRPIERALVFSPTPERREQYARDMSNRLEIEVRAVDTPQPILTEAEVICTATNAQVPLFDSQQIGPGTLINAIGQHYPNRREVDSALIARSRIIVDEWDRAYKRMVSFLFRSEPVILMKAILRVP